MAKKEFDLNTATREELVAKIHNQRQNIQELERLNQETRRHNVALTSRLDEIRKLVKRTP